MSHPGSGVETPLPKFYPTIMAKKINTEEKPRTVTDDTLPKEAAGATDVPAEAVAAHPAPTQNHTEPEAAAKPEKPAEENRQGAQASDAHILELLKKFPAYPSLYIDVHGGTFSPDTAAAIRGKAVLYRNPFYHESKNNSYPMALGNVFIKDVDGNIPYDTGSSNEKVTGLLFDVSLQPSLFTEGYGKTNEARLRSGDVCYITSLKSAISDFGIIERTTATEEEEANVNFMHGIPAYHIREFFRMSGNVNGTGKLYVMFADCSASWDAIEVMQRAAGGMINQLGVWTEQPLWKANGVAEKYSLNLVKGLNDVAVSLAELNQPLSLVLSANPSTTVQTPPRGARSTLTAYPRVSARRAVSVASSDRRITRPSRSCRCVM